MQKKSVLKKLVVVLLSIAVLGVVAALDPHVDDIGAALAQASPWWFAAAAAAMLLYYFFDALMYQFACHFMNAPQRLRDGLLTTMVGFFYSALTPFQSGGQPMQVLQMRRRGMRVGIATSVLMLKFIAWQLAVTLLGTLGFLLLGEDVLNGGAGMLVMYIFGYLMNAGGVALAVVVFLKPGWMHRLGHRLLNFLQRHRLLRRQERVKALHETWTRTIEDYAGAVGFALRRRLGMLSILLAALAAAFAYMSVTYFVYRALGFAVHGYFYVILLSSLLYIAVSFIPLPGASIASEGGFYAVFSRLFTPEARFPAMLIWRVITYYATIVLGFAAVLIDGFRPGAPREAPEAQAAGRPAQPREEER